MDGVLGSAAAGVLALDDAMRLPACTGRLGRNPVGAEQAVSANIVAPGTVRPRYLSRIADGRSESPSHVLVARHARFDDQDFRRGKMERQLFSPRPFPWRIGSVLLGQFREKVSSRPCSAYPSGFLF